jgi:hypothetical protein
LTRDLMTSHEKKQLLTLNETLSKEIQIGVVETGHEKSRLIMQFCETLSQLVPKVRIKKEEGDSNGLPTIRVHHGLMYQALPSGTEMAPFIQALLLLASDLTQIDKSLSARVAKISLPTYLVVYVSPQCKFCPQAVRQLLPLPFLNRHIRLMVIDGILFSEVAGKNKIQSVPTLILEDRLRWTGTIQLNEIIDVMTSRDPGALGPVSLEMLLKEGRANELAAMMLETQKIFPAFYEVLVHPKWPVRLGAMVVMEELIEKNLDLARQILKPLLNRFFEVDNRVKGDLLYVFGAMQQEEIIPWLETIINGNFDTEVKEAAREALDKLDQMG